VDHTVLIDQFFREQKLSVVAEWNCFQPPYHSESGWPLRLPVVDWKQTDFAVLIFQDFVTMHDGVCLELAQVEQWYGDRADQVIVIHWPHALSKYYRGPVCLVEFNVHEYQILNNLRSCQHAWQQIWQAPRDRAWQCLNGRKCDHRLRVAQYLEQHWHDGTVSLGDVVPLAGYPYSTYRGTSNEDNWLRLLSIYGQHHVNIVTETQYDQQPGIITEKTIFALLAAQIPIVIGYSGIVRDCEALGFDMFTDVVDVSYDQLPDDLRWRTALDLNHDWIDKYQPTAEISQRLLRQAKWLLAEWPRQHLEQAIEQLCGIVKVRDSQ
jgi:hypothetical protein